MPQLHPEVHQQASELLAGNTQCMTSSVHILNLCTCCWTSQTQRAAEAEQLLAELQDEQVTPLAVSPAMQELAAPQSAGGHKCLGACSSAKRQQPKGSTTDQSHQPAELAISST